MTSAQPPLLSPAELAYLRSSLAPSRVAVRHTTAHLTPGHLRPSPGTARYETAPPCRADGRSPTQFRPLRAETAVLPGCYGSARVCFADGTEALAGVKAEIEPSTTVNTDNGFQGFGDHDPSRDKDISAKDISANQDNLCTPDKSGQSHPKNHAQIQGHDSWITVQVDIPGYRDDDGLVIFVASMLREALTAPASGLLDQLYINRRWHWHLYIDVLLISPPLSYPIPLLSMTIHLALRSTALPALVSEADEDPMFNDDWDAAVPLYPDRKSPSASASSPTTTTARLRQPPVTLLVMAVGPNLFFDPSKEELAVADAVLAISMAVDIDLGTQNESTRGSRRFQIVSIRSIDPPSRLTAGGAADVENAPMSLAEGSANSEIPSKSVPNASSSLKNQDDAEEKLWSPPRGGMPRGLVARAIAQCTAANGVMHDVLDGLEQFLAL